MFKAEPFLGDPIMIKEHIAELIIELDSIINRLEIEEQYRPLKILGLKATYAFLNQIYTTLFTIAAAVA